MIQKIDLYTSCEWFRKSDTYKNNFSHNGLVALFDYLEQYEEDCGESIEFDPIAICCDFAEYESAYRAVLEYNDDYAQNVLKDSEDCEEKATLWLEERTPVIPFDGGVIIQQF